MFSSSSMVPHLRARLMKAFLFALMGLFSADLHAALSDYQIVLIGGYKGADVPGYMTENARALQEMGASGVKILLPPSEVAVTDNEPWLSDRLQKIHQRDGRPLLLIAHSKGGLETLHTLLRRADLFPQEVVPHALIVGSPVRGAAYADHLLKTWDSSLYALNPLYWFYREQFQGFQSLSTAVVERDFAETATRVDERTIRSVSSRVQFLRSRKDFAGLSMSLRESGRVLAKLGDNDGMVVTESMALKSLGGVAPFGKDLGVWEGMDHLDAFAPGLTPTPERKSQIRKLTRAMMSIVLPAEVVAPRTRAARGERRCSALFVGR